MVEDISKFVFHYIFQVNPALINTVREDVRLECSNYGDVKKVTVYDVSIPCAFILLDIFA